MPYIFLLFFIYKKLLGRKVSSRGHEYNKILCRPCVRWSTMVWRSIISIKSAADHQQREGDQIWPLQECWHLPRGLEKMSLEKKLWRKIILGKKCLLKSNDWQKSKKNYLVGKKCLPKKNWWKKFLADKHFWQKKKFSQKKVWKNKFMAKKNKMWRKKCVGGIWQGAGCMYQVVVSRWQVACGATVWVLWVRLALGVPISW